MIIIMIIIYICFRADLCLWLLWVILYQTVHESFWIPAQFEGTDLISPLRVSHLVQCTVTYDVRWVSRLWK
jgi:hypothetical protein